MSTDERANAETLVNTGFEGHSDPSDSAEKGEQGTSLCEVRTGRKTINLGRPSPKQVLFLKDTHRHVAFGGARGGGKSHAVRLKAILLAFTYAGIRLCIVRTTYKEVQQNHVEPMLALLGDVVRYNKGENVFTFPNGSKIYCSYFATDSDYTHFMGIEFDVLFLDEASNFREEWIKKMCASVRGVNNFPKRVYYTCNPSGVGMGYIKRLFIDRKFEANENPDDYSFIQSLVTDNRVLMESNPDYVRFLESLPRVLREAWLFGRWDVFEGSFFSEMRTTPDPILCEEHGIKVEDAQKEGLWTHVIKPFEPPKWWNIEMSYDFGYGKPFDATWYAIDGDGCMYAIYQWYGCTGEPNEGLKMTPEQQFKHIHEIETSHPWLKDRTIRRVADPSIWDGSRGVSVEEEASKQGVYFDKGINERIAGWMQVRERLKFDENGRAMLYFFDTCKDAIRTMPLMMFDDKKPEDLDTSLEDHFCDSLRYECMSRPIKPRLIKDAYVPDYDPLDMWKKG